MSERDSDRDIERNGEKQSSRQSARVTRIYAPGWFHFFHYFFFHLIYNNIQYLSIYLSLFLHLLKPSYHMCISMVSFSPFISSSQSFISIHQPLICLSSSSCLPVVLLLPPSNLSLCAVSNPPPLLFSRSIRHNRPLVSGLAWLWRSAMCFSSSFSRCLGFVPSASNRLFRVWDRLFLTLPSLGATGLSLSKRPDFLA